MSRFDLWTLLYYAGALVALAATWLLGLIALLGIFRWWVG